MHNLNPFEFLISKLALPVSAIALALMIALAVVLITASFPAVACLLLFLAVLPPTRKWAAVKAYHLWRAFDCLGNAFLFHDSRETISSRLGKAIYHQHPPVFNWLIIDKGVAWLLNNVDRDHCRKSIDWSVGRGAAWNLHDHWSI